MWHRVSHVLARLPTFGGICGVGCWDGDLDGSSMRLPILATLDDEVNGVVVGVIQRHPEPAQ